MSDERATLEEAEIKCQEIGRVIGQGCPEGWLFCLVLVSSGPKGFSTYVSNAQRSDMIKTLRELIGQLESGEPEV